MGRTETVELTTLCLIYDGDRILLQNRVKKDWKGYTLPGGHVEPGLTEETLTDLRLRYATLRWFPMKSCGWGEGCICGDGRVRSL